MADICQSRFWIRIHQQRGALELSTRPGLRAVWRGKAQAEEAPSSEKVFQPCGTGHHVGTLMHLSKVQSTPLPEVRGALADGSGYSVWPSQPEAEIDQVYLSNVPLPKM